MKSPYGLPCIESCLSCKLRTDDFFCALSQESLEAFNQIKHGDSVSGQTVSKYSATGFVKAECLVPGHTLDAPNGVRSVQFISKPVHF